MNPAALFEQHVEHIRKAIRAKCQGHYGEDPDDLSQTIFLKLIENDYHIIRTYQGKSSFTTYLFTVISRIFIDEIRSRKGRWRPSEQARKLGHAAMLLEELICRDHHPFDEACQILIHNHHLDVTEQQLHSIYVQLPRREGRPSEDDSEDAMDFVPALHVMPDEEIEEKRLSPGRKKMSQICAEMSRSLSMRDRLALKLRFKDDISISELTRVLGEDRAAVQKRISRLLAGFKERILAEGVNISDALDVIKGNERGDRHGE